jgi:hypothetical protein
LVRGRYARTYATVPHQRLVADRGRISSHCKVYRKSSRQSAYASHMYVTRSRSHCRPLELRAVHSPAERATAWSAHGRESSTEFQGTKCRARITTRRAAADRAARLSSSAAKLYCELPRSIRATDWETAGPHDARCDLVMAMHLLGKPGQIIRTWEGHQRRSLRDIADGLCRSPGCTGDDVRCKRHRWRQNHGAHLRKRRLAALVTTPLSHDNQRYDQDPSQLRRSPDLQQGRPSTR